MFVRSLSVLWIVGAGATFTVAASGTALAYLDQPTDALMAWMAGQLEIPVPAFAEYARRPQTMTDHARQLAATLGLRTPTMADLPAMIEAAAEAARGTARGQPRRCGPKSNT